MYRKNHNLFFYLNKQKLSVANTFLHCFRYSVDLARVINSKNLGRNMFDVYQWLVSDLYVIFCPCVYKQPCF